LQLGYESLRLLIADQKKAFRPSACFVLPRTPQGSTRDLWTVAFSRKEAYEIIITSLFSTFGMKKINEVIVTSIKLTNNLAVLATRGLEPDVARGPPVGPRLHRPTKWPWAPVSSECTARCEVILNCELPADRMWKSQHAGCQHPFICCMWLYSVGTPRVCTSDGVVLCKRHLNWVCVYKSGSWMDGDDNSVADTQRNEPTRWRSVDLFPVKLTVI
jgi:hypothetical protein